MFDSLWFELIRSLVSGPKESRAWLTSVDVRIQLLFFLTVYTFNLRYSIGLQRLQTAIRRLVAWSVSSADCDWTISSARFSAARRVRLYGRE